MADFYVYSGAVGTGDGSSWANAKTTIAAAAAAAAAGDRIFVAHDHAGAYGAVATTITFPGTPAAPNAVLCVNRAGAVPPVSADLRTTGAESTTGAGPMTINGSVYMAGMNYAIGSGANVASMNFALGALVTSQRFDNCSFKQLATGASIFSYGVSGGWGTAVEWNNVTIGMGSTSNSIRINGGRLTWTGGSYDATVSSPSSLFGMNGGGASSGSAIVRGVDLSAILNSRPLMNAAAASLATVLFERCKLAAGATVLGTFLPTAKGAVVDLVACDSGATGYREESYRFGGSIVQETTIVRTGGASDGATAKSHKFVTTANASFLVPLAYDFGPSLWNDQAGAPRTISVEIVTDGVTLKNDEVWLEVEYMGSAATPIATVDLSSRKSDVLAAGAAQPASAAAWTTTGLAAPVKQTLSATITPKMRGEITARVCVARPSATVYVDPLLRVA